MTMSPTSFIRSYSTICKRAIRSKLLPASMLGAVALDTAKRARLNSSRCHRRNLPIRSSVSRKDRDPLFEDIFEQIEGITDSWVASAENEDEGDASARRNIKKRISDLLGKRNELGGKALIERAFAQIGCPISPDELQIWNKARNATAHAAFKRKSPSQAILDQYFTCVGLLYRFILTNMGYHGEFINYTSKSWPNETM